MDRISAALCSCFRQVSGFTSLPHTLLKGSETLLFFLIMDNLQCNLLAFGNISFMVHL